MTPEEVRRILDPERRRAGFEAWKAEQRERKCPRCHGDKLPPRGPSWLPRRVEPCPLCGNDGRPRQGPLRTGRVGDSGGTYTPKGLDDVGQPSSAAAHPGEVEAQLRFVGDLIVSNPRFPSLTGPPLAVWRDLGEADGASPPPDEAELTARLLALGLIQPEGLAKGDRP